MKAKEKCIDGKTHEWRFLERWFPTDTREPTEYVFYCVHCLELKNIRLEFNRV